jgi:PUA domain protein
MENTQTTTTSTEEEVSTTTTPTTNVKQIKIETLNKTSLKSSQEKSLRKQITQNIPGIEELLEKLWPKKAILLVGRMKPYTTVYFVNDEPMFIQVKDEAVVPHIRLLHKCKLQ